MKFNTELMKELAGIYGPSGNENIIRTYIEKEIKDYVDELTIDSLGNLIARKKRQWKKNYDSGSYGSNWFYDYRYRR